jgi:hypothetical protein
MIVTPTDLTTLTFTPVQDAVVTERVFDVDSNGTIYTTLVHIDKQTTDSNGDGTPDTLDAKFCCSIINLDGTEVLVNNAPVKISQVHSVAVSAINDGSVVLTDWVAGISATMLPTLINKKATLTAWGGF